MTTSYQTIQVNVDLFNPGQFFACCGLLELADRLWPGAEGWFDSQTFFVNCRGSLTEILDAMLNCSIKTAMSPVQYQRLNDLSAKTKKQRKEIPGAEEEYKLLSSIFRESGVVFEHPFDITIDWFTDDSAGGHRFKTWAGQQSVFDIAFNMKKDIVMPTQEGKDIFYFVARNSGEPFNFDSDLGKQGGAVDVGFSFNSLREKSQTRIESTTRPILELLAFIGLQRFRPAVVGGNQFSYTAWQRSSPIIVAASTVCGALRNASNTNHYLFSLLYRTKYLKSFLPAVPFTGGFHE